MKHWLRWSARHKWVSRSLARDEWIARTSDDQIVSNVTACKLALTTRAHDFLLWLTYRTFALKRPLRLTWALLYRQFGADPARASDQGTVDNFRRGCLRELAKLKTAWPDLHYRTVKGALLRSPAPPAIAPAQLRLVG